MKTVRIAVVTVNPCITVRVTDSTGTVLWERSEAPENTFREAMWPASEWARKEGYKVVK